MKTTLLLHQTHHAIADFDSIFKSLKELVQKENGLHLFPEMYLTGYPLKDLVLQKPFIDSYCLFLQQLDEWVKIQQGDWRALVGGIKYELEPNETPHKIKNVIFELNPGIGLRDIYAKRLLPNYDIFDEGKYFSPGLSNSFYEYNNKLFALQICEDMWSSNLHDLDPCELTLKEVQKNHLKIDAIINLSASPFDVTKKQKRYARAEKISTNFDCPFIYLNRVGGEDEILFDGSSFIQAGQNLFLKCSSFAADSKRVYLEEIEGRYENKSSSNTTVQENTWESLFNPGLDLNFTPARLIPWSDEQTRDVLNALIFGFQEYSRKNGFKKFLVALSGGIDSSLVLTILKLGQLRGQEIEAIYMPSIYSSAESTRLSEKICQKLGLPLSYFPIKFLHSSVKNAFTQTFPEPFEGLTDENVQSRLRGLLLYTRSNQRNAMVLNTSNKSELAVGYSTQYGDSVGALSLLGDVYKTEIFHLAHYLNRNFGEIIPSEIIRRGPSAELRENQLDQDSLPPYERLDAMLEGILSYKMGKNELIKMGFQESEVMKTLHLHLKSEYKRAQFCPILKVKSKSFGFGYRLPVSKSYSYQFSQ